MGNGVQQVTDCGDIFGLFEVDDQGTIRYSRRGNGVGLSGSQSEELVGMDLFRDVAQFENRDALREHFRRFVAGSKPAENFSFDCIDGTRTIRSTIRMTRALEADAAQRSEIVIVNIDKVEP
jgi:hypothetical protein